MDNKNEITSRKDVTSVFYVFQSLLFILTTDIYYFILRSEQPLVDMPMVLLRENGRTNHKTTHDILKLFGNWKLQWITKIKSQVEKM